MLFIQKFPRFGIYVVMFKDIMKTFFQFFIVFALFIIAFALAFFSLFKNQVGLNRPRGYKTFFMLNSTEHGISTAHKN